MSNAPSGFCSDSSTIDGQPVPNYNTTAANGDNRSGSGFGWAYDTSLLSATFTGFDGPCFYNWAIYDFGKVTKVSRLTVSYQGYIVTGGSIYTSLDGVHWTLITEYSLPATPGEQQPRNVDHTFTTQPCCQYLAVLVRDDGGGSPANQIWGYYAWDDSSNPLFAGRAGTPQSPVSLTASLMASPTSTVNGACLGSQTLTWSTTSATSITIDQGIGSVAASGSMSVSPSSTTTYTLTASNCANSTQSTATITVTSNTVTPNINTGSTVNFGSGFNFAAGTYRISYSSGAYKYSRRPWPLYGYTLNGNYDIINPVPATGLIAGYYITDGAGNIIQGPGSSVEYSTQAEVEAANAGASILYVHSGGTIGMFLNDLPLDDNNFSTSAPTFMIQRTPTLSISATLTSINVGQSSTLNWSGSNADTYSIDQGIGSVSASGSQSVSPTVTTTYTLTGSACNINTASFTITVNQPTAPTTVTATGQCSGAVQVAWSGASNVASYIVQRSTDNSTWSQIATPSSSPYTDTPPVAGAWYFYRVIGVSGSAQSSPSASSSARSVLAAPVPTGFTATAKDGSVLLKWTVPTGSYSTLTVTIYRSTTAGAETTLVSGLANNGTYSDVTATNGTTFFYTASFTNTCGTSAQCSEVSARPLHGADYVQGVTPSTTYTQGETP